MSTAVVAWMLLSRVLLSMSWLTTLSLIIAWLVAMGVGIFTFRGLGKPNKSQA